MFGQQIFSVNTPHQSDEVFRGGSVETVPSSQYEISEDASLPEKIRSPFVHAQEDANRRRHATGIMASARGCLDVALKELGASKGTRRERIKNLSEKGIITAGIAEWAQALWDEGNDAVHDLEADMDRAIEHIEFLKLFFAVAFTLPAQIAESKTPSEKDN